MVHRAPRLLVAVALGALAAGALVATSPAQAGGGAYAWDAHGPASFRPGTAPFAAVLAPTLAAEALPPVERGGGPAVGRTAPARGGHPRATTSASRPGRLPLLFGAAGADRCRLVCVYRL
jgi:hypothetical protein